MNTEEFWRSKELNNLDRVVFSFLQSHIISNAKELAAGLDISEPTAKRALLNLKKLELIKKVKVSNLISLNNESIKTDTFENQESIKNDPLSLKKESNLIPFNEKKISSDPFFKTPIHIYITNNLININRSIYIEEGKLSLTSFASASLEDYTVKNNFVNDTDHKDLNQIKKDQTSNIQNFELVPLSESLPAPAKQKKSKKIKASFDPPTAEQVEEYMKQYVEKKSAKIPKLLTIDLAILSEQFIARYEDDWSEVKNWKNKTITFLGNQIIWNKNQKGYTTKRRKNQDAIEEIFGKGLEPETNIIDAVQTENADGSVSYDASSSNQITAQPAEEAELSAAEYIEKFKKGEIK